MTKITPEKAESWSKNIITWALLALAASQFSDLKSTVKDMHKSVVTHEANINNHEKEIMRLRDNMERWMQTRRTALTQNNKQ